VAKIFYSLTTTQLWTNTEKRFKVLKSNSCSQCHSLDLMPVCFPLTIFDLPSKMYPGSRGSLRGEIFARRKKREKEEPLVISVANLTSTLD
jgi:hypothetical protein